jgi:hypothetical protein
MNATAPIPSRALRNPAEAVTIRMAMSADAAALRRLAQLDSAPSPEPVPMLVAEIAGKLRAAGLVPGGAGRPTKTRRLGRRGRTARRTSRDGTRSQVPGVVTPADRSGRVLSSRHR